MKNSEKKFVKSSFEERKTLRMILLLFAVFTSPLICFGCIIFLSAAPDSVLPRLFRGETRIENNSGESLFLTPITTTYGHPEVITQSAFFRQRDIPLEPNQSILICPTHSDSSQGHIRSIVSQHDRLVRLKRNVPLPEKGHLRDNFWMSICCRNWSEKNNFPRVVLNPCFSSK